MKIYVDKEDIYIFVVIELKKEIVKFWESGVILVKNVLEFEVWLMMFEVLCENFVI